MLLELFVDKIEEVSYDGGRATLVTYYNTPCDDRAENCGLVAGATGERSFDAKIKSWINPYIFLHAYKLLLPYGPAVTIDAAHAAGMLRDLAGTASAKLTIRPVDPHTDGSAAGSSYRLYTESNNIAFCVARRGPGDARGALSITVRGGGDRQSTTSSYQVIRIARNTVGDSAATVSDSVDPSACVKTEVYADYEAPRQNAGAYTSLHFRSVDGMVEFLGRMLRVAPHLRPLNFDVSSGDAETARFAVSYRGEDYVVHDHRHVIPDQDGCHNGPDDHGCQDHTLEILTLVNQLIDLHKNGRELPSTGAVQVVN